MTHRIVRADVTEPLWDEFRGVMVMPAGWTPREVDAGVLALVRERRPGASLPQAGLGSVAR